MYNPMLYNTQYNTLRSSYGRNLQSQAGGYPTTGFKTAIQDPKKMGRPLTSQRAAGYSSKGRPGTATRMFDPFKMAPKAAENSNEIPLEEQIKQSEKKIYTLLDECAILIEKGEPQSALEKAKEAGKLERQLTKQREQLAQTSSSEALNLDLTYCVLLTLADAYHQNKMHQESLNTYGVIVKNKMFTQSGRLRVNMGNIYFELKKFDQAVKMYRMALDQIPQTNKEIRLRILRNMGSAFVLNGQLQDAVTSFETVMEANPDYQAGFNLLLCYYALGEKDRTRKGFAKLVNIQTPSIEQTDGWNEPLSNSKTGDDITDFELLNEDSLRAMARQRYRGVVSFCIFWVLTSNYRRKKTNERYVVMIAKLIAPLLDESDEPNSGFDWIVDTIKGSPLAEVASELEMAKALSFLNLKDFSKAMDTLKSFEKKDQKLLGTTATNLSFLYYLERDYNQAEQYADIAINHDRYNAKAHVNKGNCYYLKGDYDKAKMLYEEAVSMDALCTEAMYNLGLVNKKLENYDEALRIFEKLHAILRSSPEVILQIADIHEKLNNTAQAMEWYSMLLSLCPTDPSILAKMGELHIKDSDKVQGFQFYSESYRYHPSNIAVLSWLGSYHFDCEIYEQAINYFERAAMIQPNEIKWQLMIASCLRRSGNYQGAMATYRKIHDKWPTNIECLQFMVRLATDLHLPELQEYQSKLSKLDQKLQSSPSHPPSAGSTKSSNSLPSGHLGRESNSVGIYGRIGSTGLEDRMRIRSGDNKKSTEGKKHPEEDDWNDDIGSMLPE
ncbi:hypothetical protein BKA69DRAFT_1102264 [Paraphysoderma sedebokerense]|nr:hypothetical protein BKA69DRAFT_1102264 [Paraphysoderma sedebokerense]